MTNAQHPHYGQPVFTAGLPLSEAQAAMIMIHGRGASAESILSLTGELDIPGFAYLAPQAAGFTWYPNTFLAPIASNEPGISSGMQIINSLVMQITETGIPAEKIMLLGFSQGACLSVEYAARNARRYGGVFGLSGGLIGPDDAPRDYPGSLEDTLVFLGCSDVDSHIPLARVQHSTEVLTRLGADVEERIYPGMGHTINADEIAFIKKHMQSLVD